VNLTAAAAGYSARAEREILLSLLNRVRRLGLRYRRPCLSSLSIPWVLSRVCVCKRSCVAHQAYGACACGAALLPPDLMATPSHTTSMHQDLASPLALSNSPPTHPRILLLLLTT
jgi:hypothetical protein